MQVLVTGMHRSGTSVIARLLAECGCFIGRPEDLMPPKPDNPAGFWEHLQAYDINAEILEAAGVAWDTVTGGEIELLSQADRSKASGRIHEFISAMASHDAWVVKDPRLALTFPLWRPLLSEAVVVWCVRNPIETGVSLKGRNGFPIDLGIALWEAYTVAALKNIPPAPVVIASYNNLLRDADAEVKRLVESINETGQGTIRTPDHAAIEPIVRLGLHRSSVPPGTESDFFTEHRRRLLTLSQSAEGWSDQARDLGLSELSRDEILQHRHLLKLENQPVLVPEALVEEALRRVEIRSGERSAALDGRLVELSQRCDTILETAEARLGAFGEELARLKERVAETPVSLREDFSKLETRFGDMFDRSGDEFAGLKALLTRLEAGLSEVSGTSRGEFARLENRITETLENRNEEARMEMTELRQWSSKLVDERSRLSAELDRRDRELEHIRAELERHQTALAGYRSSFGGRALERWWRLRSKG